MFAGLRNGKIQGYLRKPSTLVLVLIVTLLFGLNPKTTSVFNSAQIQDGRLVFAPFGIVEADVFLSQEQVAPPNNQTWVLDLSITPQDLPDSVTMIAVFESQPYSEQLFVGQWRDYLLVMNGGVHHYSESHQRFSVRVSDPVGRVVDVRIISEAQGSEFWLDGALVKESAKPLRLPATPGPVYFGNTKAGDRSWLGEIHHFSLSVGQTLFSIVPVGPESNVSLRKELLPFFTLPDDDLNSIYDAALDIVINYFGFVPLGFVLASFFRLNSFRLHWMFVILPIFIVSFMIEVSQFWMPARYSSYIDVLANTLGGATGILLASLFVFGRQHAHRLSGDQRS